MVMHSKNELTSYDFQAILSHLVDMEERKDEIANEFISDISTLHDDFDYFIDDYLKGVEELIKTMKIVDNPSPEKLKSPSYLPYVIIGSTVELENVNNLNNHFFKIVWPYDISNSKDDLSCLSALGKSLMLNKPGGIIITKLNEEESFYKIKSIRYN